MIGRGEGGVSELFGPPKHVILGGQALEEQARLRKAVLHACDERVGIRDRGCRQGRVNGGFFLRHQQAVPWRPRLADVPAGQREVVQLGVLAERTAATPDLVDNGADIIGRDEEAESRWLGVVRLCRLDARQHRDVWREVHARPGHVGCLAAVAAAAERVRCGRGFKGLVGQKAPAPRTQSHVGGEILVDLVGREQLTIISVNNNII